MKDTSDSVEFQVTREELLALKSEIVTGITMSFINELKVLIISQNKKLPFQKKESIIWKMIKMLSALIIWTVSDGIPYQSHF